MDRAVALEHTTLSHRRWAVFVALLSFSERAWGRDDACTRGAATTSLKLQSPVSLKPPPQSHHQQTWSSLTKKSKVKNFTLHITFVIDTPRTPPTRGLLPAASRTFIWNFPLVGSGSRDHGQGRQPRWRIFRNRASVSARQRLDQEPRPLIQPCWWPASETNGVSSASWSTDPTHVRAAQSLQRLRLKCHSVKKWEDSEERRETVQFGA